MFTVSVGNLPPKADVLIKITYVAELPAEGPTIVFRLPSCITPQAAKEAMSTITQHQMQAISASGSTLHGGLSIMVGIETALEMDKIECSSHSIRLKRTDTMASIQLISNNKPLSEDFVVRFSQKNRIPSMWIEELDITKVSNPTEEKKKPISRAAMLTFFPDFEIDESSAKGNGIEFYFVIDCSASMGKDGALEEAKKAVLEILRYLPAQAKFNIVSFGSTVDFLFTHPKEVNNLKTKSTAFKYVNNIQANFGGTDIYTPLKILFTLARLRSRQTLIPTNIFLLTDAQITCDLSEVLELIRQETSSKGGGSSKVARALRPFLRDFLETPLPPTCRLFTMGVGASAGRHVCRSIARAGGGAYELISQR